MKYNFHGGKLVQIKKVNLIVFFHDPTIMLLNSGSASLDNTWPFSKRKARGLPWENTKEFQTVLQCTYHQYYVGALPK